MHAATRARPRPAPGPAEYPVIGNADVFHATKNIVLHADKLWRTYGDVARMNLMGKRFTLLSHPDHVARVLVSERANFVKGPAYDPVRRLFGGSLLTLEAGAWRERRSLAQPAFHRQSLERLCDIVVDSGSRYFEALLRRAGGDSFTIDAYSTMTRLTLDVVVDSLFGRNLIDTSAQVSFDALSQALEPVSDRANDLPVPRWLPTPRNLRFARTLRALDDSVYQIIEAGRKRTHEHGTLLSMLLAARDERGDALPQKAVRDEVFTLFLAGHETTALTLTWLLVMLDGRDDVLGRIVEEVNGVLNGRDPSFADVAKLVYLRQVIEETLRIRPPAPMVIRDVLARADFDGYDVLPGESVTPLIWAVHRHPDYWSDPERFDPDRFAPELVRARNKWAYIPFSAGPRTCIGNTFALMEASVLVARSSIGSS